MKVLFLSISSMTHMSKPSISQDLLREFVRHGHEVYVVCACNPAEQSDTHIAVEAGITVLRVKTGNNKSSNLIEKGLTMVTLPKLYIRAIKKYYSNIRFDLVIYPTPPITHVATVKYIKKRDHASSYLLLKDIFPQNAVDIGMMPSHGPKSLVYKHFRRLEHELYRISDRIGCMSEANVKYLLKHNPEVDPSKVEVFPNSIEVMDVSINEDQRQEIRAKYGIPLDKKAFVYGGNLGKPQGISFFMECLPLLAEMSDAYFLIVGGGTEFNKIHSFLDSKHWDNIKLLKRMPREDYDKMIPACDVGLIFLDHRFTIPNFPSRLLAYLQAGLPVLAATDPNTDLGEKIISGGFGWWCESNDAKKFCSLVCEALNSDLEQIGAKGHKYLLDNYQVKDTYEIIVKNQ